MKRLRFGVSFCGILRNRAGGFFDGASVIRRGIFAAGWSEKYFEFVGNLPNCVSSFHAIDSFVCRIFNPSGNVFDHFTEKNN